ncbi:hypothetical protein HMPREF0043_01212 [Actinobaculum sp. oral taxon 183 str. F0552]|nr:hypothetical protein HMPREF0043_01212 [Actinobaculum sp. oral taxon 183 str. F0552]
MKAKVGCFLFGQWARSSFRRDGGHRLSYPPAAVGPISTCDA